MATRRAILVILAVAFFFPACAVFDASGRTGMESEAAPVKLEATPQAPAPASVIAAAATAPVPQGQGQQPGEEAEEGEETLESEAEEPAPVPVSPIGAKEGAPALQTAPKAVPGPAPEMPAGQPGRPQYVSLNFDNADLDLVLRSIADITGINFIIGPGVKANVTMRTTTRVPSTEVFSILESVLEVNNLAAVKEGSYYKIVPIAVAQQEPQDVQVGKERADERERYVTQIVHLDHLSADEMAKILQSFLAKGAKMVVHKETNSLIIAGFSSTIKRLLDTVKALDIPSKRDNIQRIFVYFVNNVKAADLANTLNTLYGRRDLVRGGAPGTRPGQPPARLGVGALSTTAISPPPPAPGQPPPPPGAAPFGGTAPPPGAEAAPGEVVGDVTIVSDEATNALIIKTSPRNYEFIETTIKQLDIVPKQVLIELLLAQIRLSDSFNFSLEEILKTGSFYLAGAYSGASISALSGLTKATAPLVGPGFTLTFVEADKFRVVLNNLAAVTKVEVLANPHLLTANNKEANIQIGQEVPIITNEQASLTTVSQPTTSSSGVFRSIQQKDIGIILKIKPHVNEKRLVTLDIEAENTAVDKDTFGNTGSPSFLKTITKTAIVIEDGQSLVIGGIIRTDKTKGYTGIPFLSSIPLLGYLFRSTSKSMDRNELIILITPRVIASPDEGRALTEQFMRRVESLEPILKGMPQFPQLKP